MTITTFDLKSTAVDSITFGSSAVASPSAWASGFRATYTARRRDQLRALSAYAFCQPFSYGAWANEIKFNDVMTIDQLNTIG